MKISLLGSFVLTICVATSCHALTYNLSGPMDVFQATTNPANIGNGTGTISGDYNDVTNTLNYSISWQDLTSSVTNMHFHVGAVGVPGGVDLAIPGPWSSPQIGSSIILSASQETNLLSGLWYVNVHTSSFPGGEIRGQVNPAVIPEPSTVAMASVVLFGMLSVFRSRNR